MENTKNMKATLLSIGTLAALLLAGCSQQAKEDMSQAGASASNAASHTGDAVSADTSAAGQAAQDAGAKVVDATKDAGAAVAASAKKAGADVAAAGDAAVQAGKNVAANTDDALMTPKVKQALLDSSGLETKNIDVDTKGGTITLKGTVPSAKQKTQAETVAKGIAGSKYKVVDTLTVSAATGATP